MSTKNLVLRTMYIDPDVDDELRTEAFDSRTSKNDLLRRYLRLGMEATRKGTASTAAIKDDTSQRQSAVVESRTKVATKRDTSTSVKKSSPNNADTRKKPAAKLTAEG